VLFVAAEETLEPEDGPSSNITEPGDKVESSFVLLSLSTDTLVGIDPKDVYWFTNKQIYVPEKNNEVLIWDNKQILQIRESKK